MVNYPYQQAVNPFFRQQNESQPLGLRGRPVSSIDEVRATSIDFDGSVFYFPDLANKRIYTKQINYDGTSTLNIYEFRPTPTESSQYVTREEFNALIQKLAQAIPQQQPAQEQQKQETKSPPQTFKF